MAKNAKALSNSAAILASVTVAAFHCGENDLATRAAMTAAEGIEPAKVRLAFISGFMASRLAPLTKDDVASPDRITSLVEKAQAVMALPGSTGKAANRRTVAQETVYAAARKAWSRFAPKAKVATGEKRGTKSASVKKAKAKAEKIAPKFKTVAGSLEWAQKSVAFLLSGLKKNAAPAPVALAADALAKAIAAEIAARK
jgi:hypothetical protein